MIRAAGWRPTRLRGPAGRQGLALAGAMIRKAPSHAVPSHAVPFSAVPFSAVFIDAVFIDAVFIDRAPIKTVPINSAHTHNVPTHAAMSKRAGAAHKADRHGSGKIPSERPPVFPLNTPVWARARDGRGVPSDAPRPSRPPAPPGPASGLAA